MNSPSAERMVAKGMLPENLPPVVQSRQMAPILVARGSNYLVTSNCVGEQAQYSASKRGGQRRLFNVPHPAFIYDGGLFLERHWEQIEPLIQGARGSLSKPTFTSNGPRSSRITPHSELPRRRLSEFARYKYCLITDVARCYPSIYTHSISWALHGKVQSQADTNPRSANIFGNRLDFIVRQSQRRQTGGIPVGPDMSRVIGEIILSAVDREYQLHAPSDTTYLRHVDDYWIAGTTRERCEQALTALKAALKCFELDVNELKTKIVLTNEVYGEAWPVSIERLLRRTFVEFTHRGYYDPISTISHIFDTARANSDDGIIKHAIRKLDQFKAWRRNWEILEPFLAQCAIHYPHSLDYVARVVAWRNRLGVQVDKVLWGKIASQAAAAAGRLGHDSEVLWALWLLKELDLKISADLFDQTYSNTGYLVSAFLTRAYSKGLVRKHNINGILWSKVLGNQYADACWPLSLELSNLGINNPAPQVVVGADDVMMSPFNAGVSLLDWNAAPSVFLQESDDGDIIENVNPENAIEDYTSDYDDGFDDVDDDEDEPY